MSDLYNATIEIFRSNKTSTIFRVHPDMPIRKYIPGQYGSLGLMSDSFDKLVKRAYSISSSIVDLKSYRIKNRNELNYLEFYINRVPKQDSKREQITPKLFKLKDGDRVFCGEKIVGHYVLPDDHSWENIILISSHTGESPNNSIVNSLLLAQNKLKIVNINVGKNWNTLYKEEHDFIEKKFSNYNFIQFEDDSLYYENFINDFDESNGNSLFSFKLDKDKTLVMICGDPKLIGAPIKKGGWEYDYPDYGLINVLKAKSFEISTRFKKGNIIFESYW